MNNAGILLKLFAAAAVAMVLLLATATWFFFKRPLTLDAAFSRFALGQAGLTRHHLAAASGSLTVFEGGTGPPLVLVHGIGDQAGSWARVVSPLVEEYRVIIPDLAGHGSSDPDEGAIDIDRLVAGFSQVLENRCPEGQISLVGHGFGAWLAVKYALDNPDEVARIVAVNGGPTDPDESKVNLFPANRSEARQMMEGLMGSSADIIPAYVLDDIVRRAASGPAARIDTTRLSPAVADRLDELTDPVALIWGAEDELYDLAYASRLLERLPNASITTLDACGHMPQRECPVEFVDALQSVLARTADQSASRP